jgi:hypothetical protein
MPEEKPKRPNSLHDEWKTDYEAARLRDSGQDYESFLREATEKAKARMQGKDQGYER